LIQIIKLKTDLDANYAEVQVETYKRQVEIFKQAILEVVPPDMQAQIVARVKKIREREEDLIAHEKLLVQTVESSAEEI
jgi:tetrahydromethanopterin S-methyltransferase subunit A